MPKVDLENVSLDDMLAEVKRRMECLKKPEKRLILVGPPGCGKGTNSEKLRKENCLCHLATGDMLRAAVAAGTEIGKKAKAIMQSGGLVSDDIVVGIIKDAIKAPQCSKGFILDGFPRTVPQAEMLDTMLAETGERLDRVVEFKIDDKVLIPRITGRLIHKPSGRSYHKIFNKPKVEGKDNVTGEPLMQRSDDNETSLAKRLNAYHNETVPVLDYYRTRGILRTINADQGFSAVWNDLNSATTFENQDSA
jgi:adenylate kinase